MSPDIQAVTILLKEERVWNAVRHHIEYYHSNQVGKGGGGRVLTLPVHTCRPSPQSMETYVFSPTMYTAAVEEEEEEEDDELFKNDSEAGVETVQTRNKRKSANVSADQSRVSPPPKRQTRGGGGGE